MSSESIRWENADARRYLMEKGGSKAGSHAFLRDTQANLREHLPSGTVYLAPGEDPVRILERIDFSRQKIVRACHPLDVFGMVDVIPSEAKVRGRDAVLAAIERVRADSTSEDVAAYVEYETGKPFDGQVGILVQDHNEGQSGSIIEHPHQRGVFRIAHEFSEYTFTEADRDLSPVTKKVLALYRKVQESGLMPYSHSFQMEWGERNGGVLFYQARLFKPHEPAADFDLEGLTRDLDGDYFDVTRPFDAFGLTGPEGTEVMHRADLTPDISTRNSEETIREFLQLRENETQVAYALNTFHNRESLPLWVQPRNIGAYLSYQTSILAHGDLRWVKRAPVSLVKMGFRKPPRGEKEAITLTSIIEEGRSIQRPYEEIRLKVYSNGIQGMIHFMDA
ncbi:MAG: hypothetical protein WC777_00735 [Candidatus Gracilibacteria bacterium]|jgi:hypothetical protein